MHVTQSSLLSQIVIKEVMIPVEKIVKKIIEKENIIEVILQLRSIRAT